MRKLEKIVEQLRKGERLPASMRDHALQGRLSGYRECHISFDRLLLYGIRNDILILELTATGTHRDLFGE